MVANYTQGSKELAEDLTLPYAWVSLHINAQLEQDILQNTRLSHERNRVVCELQSVLESLQELDAKNWASLCNISGMTIYGAVALSWCQDAKLPQVWEGWHASRFPLKPLPEYERPARFLNPALLPQSNKLSEIVAHVNAQKLETPELYDLAVCATIVALKDPLDFDFAPDAYAKIRPQIAAFLKSRMLEKANRSAQEEALITDWSAKIKGSEFDIWEGA